MRPNGLQTSGLGLQQSILVPEACGLKSEASVGGQE
jgi:hypothetical protein